MIAWYRHNPADVLAAIRPLDIEARGAFSIILEMILERGGPIPDDEYLVAGQCKISRRLWRAIRARLLAAGVIHLAGNCLHAGLAEDMIDEASSRIEKRAAAGRSRSVQPRMERERKRMDREFGENSNKNSDRDGAMLEQCSTHNITKITSLSSRAKVDDVIQALAAARIHRKPNAADKICMSGWIELGADPDRIIIPTIETVAARATAPIYSLKFFDAAIRDRLVEQAGKDRAFDAVAARLAGSEICIEPPGLDSG